MKRLLPEHRLALGRAAAAIREAAPAVGAAQREGNDSELAAEAWLEHEQAKDVYAVAKRTAESVNDAQAPALAERARQYARRALKLARETKEAPAE